MRQHWVMDYETLSNCFLGVFQDVKSDDTRVFVISTMQNDLEDFLDFLEHNIQLDEWHVSFNGLGFDGQITEYILRNADQLREMFSREHIIKTIRYNLINFFLCSDCFTMMNRHIFNIGPIHTILYPF